MTILFFDKKVTATEFAKLAVEDSLDAQLQYTQQDSYRYMTPKEKEQVRDALTKQKERVIKFLDWNKLWRKFTCRPEVDKRKLHIYREQ